MYCMLNPVESNTLRMCQEWKRSSVLTEFNLKTEPID